MYMAFDKATLHHLDVQMIEHPLDPANPLVSCLALVALHLIFTVVFDEIQQLGVNIVKAFVTAKSSLGKGDKCASRQSVFGSTL
jgi:hypothetical protein